MRAIRVIQTSAITALLIAASAMLVVSAHATERHSDTPSTHREQQRDSREYPHIHADRERYEHPRLHSEGTREDRDLLPYEDAEDYMQQQRLQQFSDEPEDE
uniref:Secreted protein n=1 Tax=Pseudomonas phage Nican01 TaxID=3138540 RepID=A0AAU6W058_9CAUD